MSLSFSERFYGWREIFPFSLQQKLLKTPFKENLYLEMIRELVERDRTHFGDDRINLMLYMDMRGLLPGDMLTKVDRMSMANSLEVRVPLLDHTFVEYVFKLHGNFKLRRGRGKYILMESFKKLLPRSLHRRPKKGFEMPIGAWFRKELRFLIEEYLSETVIRKQDFFNVEVIERLIRDHMEGRQDTSWHLWNLIVFQHWYKTYMS
jgi:asparagine synthase (glutamine-hydrolysing)